MQPQQNRLLAAAGLLASLLACGVPDQGPSMLPGQDCLSCHNGQTAPQWTVAGTVFSDPNAPVEAGMPDAQVIITDSTQHTLTLLTNSVGNFYTAEVLAFPLTVKIQRGTWLMEMQSQPGQGSCNTCHSIGNGNGAPGRLFIPYQNLSRRP